MLFMINITHNLFDDDDDDDYNNDMDEAVIVDIFGYDNRDTAQRQGNVT